LLHLQLERADAIAERKELERVRATMTKAMEKELQEVRKEADRQKAEAAGLERDRGVLTEKV
jgi:hypothetical protein